MYRSLLQSEAPQVCKFGVATVKAVAKNENFTELQLEPWIQDQQIVDDILAQLTADERRKFRVGQDKNACPSIELCLVGEWYTVSLCCVGQFL